MDRNEISMVLAERIGKLRADAGESQQHLADALEVKRETVKFWESGERQIKGADIAALAEHFNVSADFLLGLTDTKTTDKDLSFVCEYTGMSEEAVNTIRTFPHVFPDTLNSIIEAECFDVFARDFIVARDFAYNLEDTISVFAKASMDDKEKAHEMAETLDREYEKMRFRVFEYSESAMMLLNAICGYKALGTLYSRLSTKIMIESGLLTDSVEDDNGEYQED